MGQGVQVGIEKGKADGKREEAIAIALEFKKMGLPIADIAKGTGLSIEEPRRALRSKIEKLYYNSIGKAVCYLNKRLFYVYICG